MTKRRKRRTQTRPEREALGIIGELGDHADSRALGGFERAGLQQPGIRRAVDAELERLTPGTRRATNRFAKTVLSHETLRHVAVERYPRGLFLFDSARGKMKEMVSSGALLDLLEQMVVERLPDRTPGELRSMMERAFLGIRVVWHGANIYGHAPDEQWMTRLLATGMDCRPEQTLRAQLQSRTDHTFSDLNLGNVDENDDLWIVGAPTGRDLLDERVLSGSQEVWERFLDSPVVIQGGHLFALDTLSERRFYVLSDLTEMQGLESFDSDRALAILADGRKDVFTDRAREALEAEIKGRHGIKGLKLREPNDSGSFEGDWISTAIDLEDGWHFFLMSAQDVQTGRINLDHERQVRTVVSATGFPTADDAVEAGMRAVIEGGGAAQRLSPTLMKSLNDGLEERRRAERREKIKEMERKGQLTGWRSDGVLTRHLGEAYSINTCRAWADLPLLYMGPRLLEMADKVKELREEVPILDYRPFRDVVIDYGIGEYPEGPIDLPDPDMTRTGFARIWSRVTDLELYRQRSALYSPWIWTKAPVTDRDRDFLVIETWAMSIDLDEWYDLPLLAIVDTRNWAEARIQAPISRTDKYVELARGYTMGAVGTLAYLARMPELLYEVRSRPAGPPEHKGDKKPWTRQE